MEKTEGNPPPPSVNSCHSGGGCSTPPHTSLQEDPDQLPSVRLMVVLTGAAQGRSEVFQNEKQGWGSCLRSGKCEGQLRPSSLLQGALRSARGAPGPRCEQQMNA